MIFSSPQFLFLFLPLALAGFWLLPTKRKKAWLILLSFVFYSIWHWQHLGLLLISVFGNYALSGTLSRTTKINRHLVLVGGISLNLLLLAVFKYTGFFLDNIRPLLGIAWRPEIILPLAISFFTFTQIAYLVDVYRDRRTHCGLSDYVFFVIFFPHLIAGPIVRHWEIVPQTRSPAWRVSWETMAPGLAMLVFGLLKKTLLADPLGGYVEIIYGAAEAGKVLNSFDAWAGTLAFGLQIYFDFSGYSDMAIGLALMFGLRFPVNFDSPYRADSIAEFWRRWHISLTRFLRDYLYIPLGGNRQGLARQCLNILVTMLLSGLWHGAGWMFLFWGALHGVFLVMHRGWSRVKEAVGWTGGHWWGKATGQVLTLLAVAVAWVFFRSSSFPAACGVIEAMFGLQGPYISDRVTDPNGPFGMFWRILGLRFIPGSLEGLDRGAYTELSKLFLAGTMLALFFPNTQQLLRRWRPVLGQISAATWELPLSGWSGFLLGIGFWLVLRTFFTARPNPFIYFNF